MTERVDCREAMRLKLARLVGVHHDGSGNGESARPERRVRFWERLRLQEHIQGRRLELGLHLHLIRAARSTKVELGSGLGVGLGLGLGSGIGLGMGRVRDACVV